MGNRKIVIKICSNEIQFFILVIHQCSCVFRQYSCAPDRIKCKWENVDNYFNVTTGVGTSSHYFIDYKNWRYFHIKESKTSVPGTPGGQHAIEYGACKSLDKLLNWPDDWKKYKNVTT